MSHVPPASHSLTASFPEIEIGVNGDDHPLYTGSINDLGEDGFIFQLLYENNFDVPNKMPEGISFAVGTNVRRKVDGHRVTLDPYGIPAFHSNSMFQKAVTDHEEREKTAQEIALGKLYTAVLGPVKAHAEFLTDKKRIRFFNDLARRVGASSPQHIIAMSDDRSMYLDSAFKNILFEDLRQHHDSKIQEVFEKPFPPGERLKEVMGAKMGILNFLYDFDQARKNLKEKDISFEDGGVSTTTLSFAPLQAGLLPIPEQGLYIKVRGPKSGFRSMTKEDVEHVKKGGILTLDSFEQPDFEGLPKGFSLYDYKRIIAPDQTAEEKRKYQGLDQDAATHYLTDIDSSGAAMTLLMRGFGVEKKNGFNAAARYQEAYNFRQPENKTPKTVFSTLHLLTDGLKEENLNAVSSILPKGYRFANRKLYGGLPKFLERLEKGVFQAQAFLVQDPDLLPITAAEKNRYKEDNAVKIRDLKTALMASYFITMSTQIGAKQHHGRPHLVSNEWFEKFGLYHADLVKLGLVGDEAGEAYGIFSNQKDLKKGLEKINRETYHHMVETPKNGFKTRKELRDKFDINDNECAVICYGSASGEADETYRHSYHAVQGIIEGNAQNNIKKTTLVTGGGTRAAMGGAFDSALEMMQQGHAVKFIGIRSESDVSPLEGEIEDYLDEKGITLKPAPNGDPKHFVACHGKSGEIHIYKDDRLLPRQSNIASIGDVVMLADGGKGTVLEFFITALNNAAKELTGAGILQNDKIVPLFVMNRDFKDQGRRRGVFDVVLKPWRQHKKLLNLREVKGDDPVPETVTGICDYIQKFSQPTCDPNRSNTEKNVRQPHSAGPAPT